MNINGGLNYMTQQSLSTPSPSFMPLSQSNSPSVNTPAPRLRYNADEGIPLTAPHQRSRHNAMEPQQFVQFVDTPSSAGTNLEANAVQSPLSSVAPGSSSPEVTTSEFSELGGNMFNKNAASLPSTSRNYSPNMSSPSENQRPVDSSTPQSLRHPLNPLSQVSFDLYFLISVVLNVAFCVLT